MKNILMVLMVGVVTEQKKSFHSFATHLLSRTRILLCHMQQPWCGIWLSEQSDASQTYRRGSLYSMLAR